MFIPVCAQKVLMPWNFCGIDCSVDMCYYLIGLNGATLKLGASYIF